MPNNQETPVTEHTGLEEAHRVTSDPEWEVRTGLEWIRWEKWGGVFTDIFTERIGVSMLKMFLE